LSHITSDDVVSVGRAEQSGSRTTEQELAVGLAMNPPGLSKFLFGPNWETLEGLPIRRVGDIITDYSSPEGREALRSIEVLLTGWGAPSLTDDDLDAAPQLRYVLHAGGQAASLLPASAHDRGIAVANAGWANGIPVAEYAVAMIILAGKSALAARNLYRDRRRFIDRELEFPTSGNYDQAVGIVGASRIGRMVIERLRAFDLSIFVFDPYVSDDEVRSLGATRVGLDELFSVSRVVSLHPPLNSETSGMIGAKQLGLLRDGATLINTARGGIVDGAALRAELRSGRINAVLDVTAPEVLPTDDPLFDLPNVFLTPHIAGSMGYELRRMGTQLADELLRISLGQPLGHPEVLR
jgi:phosphoglycerate dehydrogenase-like enzyme